MLAATRRGLPTLIHEQNAILGRANRLLAPRVGTIATSFAAVGALRAGQRARVVETGNPVRPAVAALRAAPYAAPGDGPIALLVIGGSQGARILSAVVPAALARLDPALRRRLAVMQQARPEDLAAARGALSRTAASRPRPRRSSTTCRRGLPRAQLVIARAGASTVAELDDGRAARRSWCPIATPPTITRPPTPRTLAAAGAAWVMAESAFTPDALAARIAALLAAPERARARRRRRRTGSAGPTPPQRLADLVVAAAGGNGAAPGRAGGRRMRALPLDIGTIHFVGIGGIGMSGIAEILHNLGYAVQGSDIADGANVRRLQALGIPVAIGHRAENLGEAQVVVVSSAVKPDNPEIVAARARLMPVVRRAEMLGELMRLKWSIAVAGTHGKTTTTSLVGALLDTAKLDPTVINGGIINAYGTNARLGSGDWMVVEADESDGTFVKLPATIAVVTNIDPEHLDFYGNFEALQQAFESFVANIPFYGFAALCIDHPVVQGMIPRLSERRIVTYGLTPQADIRAVNVEMGRDGARYDAIVADRRARHRRTIAGLLLPMFGRHNVQNSLAAIAVADEMGLADETVRAALAGFKGVKRRFTKTGVWNGVTVIDDYGHHPVEIAAVLRAARGATQGNVIAVVQPHRYTRLANLFAEFCTCFNDADTVLVADIYPAGEAPIEGVDRDALVAGLQARGHRNALALPAPAQLAPLVADLAQPGDFVVCLGAGSITQWANALPAELEALRPARRGARA